MELYYTEEIRLGSWGTEDVRRVKRGRPEELGGGTSGITATAFAALGSLWVEGKQLVEAVRWKGRRVVMRFCICWDDEVLAMAVLLLGTWRKVVARCTKAFVEGTGCRFFCKDEDEPSLRGLLPFLVAVLFVATRV